MRFALLLFCFAYFAAWAKPAPTSANVPPSHSLYQLYDQLMGYGCLSPTLRLFKPQNYLDLRPGIFLPEGQKCVAPNWLLKRADFLRAHHLRNKVGVNLLLAEQDVVSLSGLQAQVLGIYPDINARPVTDGGNLFLEAELAAGGGYPYGLMVGLSPGFVFGLTQYSSVYTKAFVQEAYLKGAYKKLELSWGRIAMQFGDARHGTLLVSSHSRPLDVFRLALRPVAQAPLGQFSFESWYAPNQGKTLARPNTKLLGVGLGWMPAGWLELGVMHVHQFGGTGAPSVGGGDLLKMLVYSAEASIANRALAVHTNLWISGLAKLYGQLMFDAGTSYLVGMYFPKLPELADVAVNLEHVRTARAAYQDGFWTQGWVYRGTPLGHYLGPDANAIYADFDFALMKNWAVTLGLFGEQRGVSVVATETRKGVSVGAKKAWGRYEVDLSSRYALISNHKQMSANDVNIWALFGSFKMILM